MRIQNNVSSGTPVNVASTTEQDITRHKDYRLLENRREWLVQWFASCVSIGDIDPHIWGMQYLNKRYEHNIEEKLWFAWLFHTYQLPQCWVFKMEFPDEELASVERLTNWTNENYSRLTFQTDTKWSKGHLAAMYSSYAEWLAGRSQQESFTLMCRGSPEENFKTLWDLCTNKFHKFGRYTTWFYLQVLKHTCNIPVEPDNLYLSDYSGSKSHRNGLCYAAGKDEWVGQRLTNAEYMWLEGFGADVLKEARARFPSLAPQMDLFSLETCLCSAKKLWRTRDGRYAGYYLDRQSEDIVKTASKGWSGIDWTPLWQMREETIPLEFVPRYAQVDKQKMSLFLETGNFHHYAKEE